MTEYFRPQVRRELQRPLLIASIKLRRPMKEVATEAVRSFVESVLEDNLGDNDYVNPQTIDSAIEAIKKIEPMRC